MKEVKVIDLFSGIGGFSLAAHWVFGSQLNILSFCEIDPFCQKVLKKNFPNVPIHDDIQTMKGDDYDRADILVSGFPCQPYSKAGKQEGKEDDRDQWDAMFDFVQKNRSTWIIAENVDNIINFVEFQDMCTSLEAEGYRIQAVIVPAAGVGAVHRRNRVWIIGHRQTRQTPPFHSNPIHTGSCRKEEHRSDPKHREAESRNREVSQSGQVDQDAANTHDKGLQGHKWDVNQWGESRWIRKGKDGSPSKGAFQSIFKQWGQFHINRLGKDIPEPLLQGMDDGVPCGMDRHWKSRIIATGNTIVPQIPARIMLGIKVLEGW